MSDNGIAMPILRLGETVVEKRPIEIERNGQPTILKGFVYGKRCPGSVKAELAAAQQDFVNTAPPPLDDDPEDVQIQKSGNAQRAYHAYLSSCLRILIPDLTWDEADLFAGDDDPGGLAHRILVYLQWFKDRSEANPENPPVEATAETTTEESSPTLSPAMVSE